MRGQALTPKLATSFEAIRSEYNAAKTSRFRRRLSGVYSAGSGADYHYRTESDYLRILELSRDFDRNNMILGQAITRLVNNVLQGGLRVDPDTGNPDLDLLLADRFERWAENEDKCHSEGEHTLHDIARMVLRAVIVDGDIVVLPLRSGELQCVEAHRIRTPRNTTKNVVLGVLLDEMRRRVQYWITKDDLSTGQVVQRVSDIKQYDARDADGNRQVFHVYLPKRLSQTRGVSALCPVVDPVGMHDDIQFAKLVQQQIVSCFAIIREREAQFSSGEAAALGSQETETRSDGTSRTIEGISPGMQITGAAGETIKGFSPAVPNAEFFDHAMLILTIIAVNLDMPVQVLLLDPKQTNFSGWRGAIDQAREGWRNLQRLMMRKFYRPVYEWKVRQLIDMDPDVAALAKTVSDPLKHQWRLPHWSYIEPKKDAESDALIIDKGLNSRRGVLGRRGLDIDVVDREQVADQARRIEAAIVEAKKIASSYPDAHVTWRDILGMEPLKIAAQQKSDSEPDKPERTDDVKDG